MNTLLFQGVLETLFSSLGRGEYSWEKLSLPQEEYGFYREEYAMSTKILAVKKRMKRKAAPDLSDIPAKAWALATTTIEGRIKNFFMECLKRGVFPFV